MESRPTASIPCRDLGVGVGLRSAHYAEVLATRPAVDWFEATSENYMGVGDATGGYPLRVLEQVRQDYPVVLHGVSLSIGSVDPVNEDYLRRLGALVERVQPEWVSDHLCWTGVDGRNLHDLLPLPFTEETLRHLVPRIAYVQEKLKRKILLENVSSYVSFEHSEMTEWQFLAELAERADCGLLLDLNNVYVSGNNHGFDPGEFIRGIPAKRVGQLHLAGHSRQGDLLVDTHDAPVCDPVWELFAESRRLWGPISTLIEWDGKIPPLSELMAEAGRAQAIARQQT